MAFGPPFTSHLEPVFLDQIQRAKQTVKARNDPQPALGMIEITCIPPLRSQCPIYLTVKCMHCSASVARMKRGAPLLVPSGSLQRQIGTDFHGAHETAFGLKRKRRHQI